MKNIISFKVVAIGWVLLFTSHVGNAQVLDTLTINASNFKSDTGKAIVHLFRKEDDIPKTPFLKVAVDIKDGKAVIPFPQLQYGEYAAILFHDENTNGTLDHKWGFPNESMGFSNDWNLSLFSGMPTFSKLRVEFSKEKMNCKIQLKK